MTRKSIYSAVGEWLVDEQGCQKDGFSKGVLHSQTIGGENADVFGIRYEISSTTKPYLILYGYIVEVAESGKDLESCIAKADKISTSAEYKVNDDWHEGVDYVEIYIAYGQNIGDQNLQHLCESRGIGILEISITSNGEVVIDSTPYKPKRIQVQGISHGKGPGHFERSIKNKQYLFRMFMDPDRIYYNKLNFTTLDCRSAFDFLVTSMLRDSSSIVAAPNRTSTVYLKEGTPIIDLSPSGERVVLNIIPDRSYLIYSKERIFDLNEQKELDIQLKKFYSSVIKPLL
jgi:hypothetical protein